MGNNVMNQGEIIITYRVDSRVQSPLWSNVQKDTRAREISTRLNQNMASFGRLNQVCGVANTIKKFGIVAAGVIGGGTFGAKMFIDLPVACKQHKRRWRRSLGQPRRPTCFWSTVPIRYLVANRFSPTPQKSSFLHYQASGRTAQQVIPYMDTVGYHLSLQILQNLALVFGQVTSRGVVWTRCFLQLITNNIPLTTILGRSSVFLWKRLLEESMAARLKEEFTAAYGMMAEPRY